MRLQAFVGVFALAMVCGIAPEADARAQIPVAAYHSVTRMQVARVDARVGASALQRLLEDVALPRDADAQRIVDGPEAAVVFWSLG